MGREKALSYTGGWLPWHLTSQFLAYLLSGKCCDPSLSLPQGEGTGCSRFLPFISGIPEQGLWRLGSLKVHLPREADGRGTGAEHPPRVNVAREQGGELQIPMPRPSLLELLPRDFTLGCSGPQLLHLPPMPHRWTVPGSYASKNDDNSFNKYWLSTFYVPGTVLGA